MDGTFLDIVVICFVSGLVLILTGLWTCEFSGAYMVSYDFPVYFNKSEVIL
ncbi:MAG: hypothetical protein ACPK85_14195 [Methanosarcina sp.]